MDNERTRNESADARAGDSRRVVFGIVITAVLFLLVIAIFTLIIMSNGGTRNSYYNNLMQRGQQGTQ